MKVTLRQASGGVAALLVGLAGIMILFSGPVPALLVNAFDVIIAPLPPSLMHIILAVGLVGLGIVYFWEGREAPDRWVPLVDEPPEQPQNAPHVIGDTFDTHATNAQADIQLTGTTYEETTTHRDLRALLHRSIRLTRKCSAETATEMINRGEWTTDPIAAAFLADESEYPTRYQVFKWARPADAFERAVAQTSHAVDQFVHEELPGTPPPALHTQPNSAPGNWFERVHESDTAHENHRQSKHGETNRDSEVTTTDLPHPDTPGNEANMQASSDGGPEPTQNPVDSPENRQNPPGKGATDQP
jgi:hypothetical protein